MLDHYLQRDLVYKLAFSDGLRFSELKPGTVENKLFTYHLHKVEKAGLVTKNEAGLYALTPEGRRIGVQVFAKQQTWVDQAYSVLLLVVRRKSDGAWLLCKRKTYPLLGKVGLVHAAPLAGELVTDTAARVCHEKTGLQAQFTPQGHGYFKIYDKQHLESFIHFALLVAEDAAGGLQASDELADYFWELAPDFTADTMLPTMSPLVEAYQRGEPFFVDQELHL